MLKSLHISNYALIDTLDITFQSGFSVITGETGAGKSIILGALGLLLGQRADIKAIKVGMSKCTVEATFDISDYGLHGFFDENELEYDANDCIIRRELYVSGKSRAYINDSPVSLSMMKELGEQLIDVHSQHKNLLLNHEDFQLGVVDAIAHTKNQLNRYQQLFNKYKAVSQQLDELIEQVEKNRQDEDYIRFQWNEINQAGFQEDEEETLQEEADVLNHAEDIKSGLFKVDMLLNGDEAGLLVQLRECVQTIDSISDIYSPARQWGERIESCRIELEDLRHDLSSAMDNVDFNPNRLDYVNERLNLIYSLEKKHKVDTVKDLLALEDKYSQMLQSITNSDEEIEHLKKEKETCLQLVMQEARSLSDQRKAAIKVIEKQMKEYLIPLGMPNVRFAIQLEQEDEPSLSGIDHINFLFSANKNVPLQEVASIASGGEISRVMLSIKALIAGAMNLPTIIFDEIDTGVSGSIAEKMALMMQDMGKQNRQVISITHLPQIAAKGSVHYKVYKEDNEQETTSHIVRLNDKERVVEVANMLSGSVITEEALNNAKVLLGLKEEVTL
ncbi:MAG: DNA repair protein RecN [Phocaeicola sp.]|nr:DNA repair protein RecN [Phocaeicola sp.]